MQDRGGRRRAPAALALLALTFSACTQFAVRSKQDPAVDFGRLQTYAWLPVGDAAPADQRVQDRAIDRRIRTATEQELQAKGYRPAGAEPADFLLNYRISTSPDDALVGTQRNYVGDPWWGGWSGAYAVYESSDAGTLYLAALDAGTKRMIWVGAAHARLLPHISYEKRVKRVDAAVQKILAAFPKR